MGALIIPTARLELVLQTADEVIARIEAMSPADRAQVSPDWLARVGAATPGDPWTFGFSVVERASGAVVGDCGYKGPPDPEGCVEIAYGLAAEYRGRGYATEAARALVAFAFKHDAIRLVRAHTLPERNASTRVLTKCGFRHIGEVIDPEDGMVWRWERGKQPAEPAGPASCVTTSITRKERFDDVAPKNPDGTVDYAYHGFNYVIAVEDRIFQVRTYDDVPGVATVISPADARTCPGARALVEFITSTLGCTGIQFYCGPVGTYRRVEIQTLEFTET